MSSGVAKAVASSTSAGGCSSQPDHTVSKLCSVTGMKPGAAKVLLKRTAGDVDAAALLFFDEGPPPEVEEDAEEHHGKGYQDTTANTHVRDGAQDRAHTKRLSSAESPLASKRRTPGTAELFTRLQSSTKGRAIKLSRRLQTDLLEVMAGNVEERGFDVELADDDRLDVWRVRYFSFPENSQMHKDLERLKAVQKPGSAPPALELELSFSDDYPFSPPSVRIARPRLVKGTGYVIGGAICMELLTPQGWNCLFSIEATLEQIRAHLVQGKAALDLPHEISPKLSVAPAAPVALAAPGAPAGAPGVPGAPAAHAAPAAPFAILMPQAAAAHDSAVAGAATELGSTGAARPATASEKQRAAEKFLACSSYAPNESSRAFKSIVDYHKRKGWHDFKQLNS